MADRPADAAVANASSNARSRALSASSDRPSATGIYNLTPPPPSVWPDAAFIAASAASQIVTNNHDVHIETWYDQFGIDPSGEASLISNGALRLANNFLDNLLFNILATAKSTTLSSLRSAVIDVLKPKLARDVINSADEELKEYLGGGGIENLVRSSPLEAPGDWDLELIWKRTRLRCMVYSSLGDMEEEDEDYHMEHEQLNGEVDVLNRLVSPPVAIFLTSILECMGEQVLILAGQAALTRLRAKYEQELKDGTSLTATLSDRIVVEELDMERVALDRTLGRLWRAWKKKIRSSIEPNSPRPISRGSANDSGGYPLRYEGTATESPATLSQRELDTPESQATLSQREEDYLDPSALPLPDSDVEATYSDEEDEQEELPLRPKSCVVDHSFVSKASIERSSSLPSRKKPVFISIPNDDRSDVRSDQSATESAINTEVVISPEIEAELESQALPGAITSDPADKVAPDAVAVVEIVAPSSTAINTDAIDKNDNRRDELEETKDYGTEGEIRGFVEEPRILTSSWVSVGGGKGSPTASESGRHTSILLTGSNSVRSVRVIEVPGPRSRASSVESNPPNSPHRPLGTSHERGTSRSPIVEENGSGAIPHVMVTKTTPGAVLSFIEGHQDIGTALTPPPPPRNRSPPKLTSPLMPSHTSGPSKAAATSNTTAPPQEDRHDNFQRSSGGLRSPPLPTLPERSTSRPIYAQPTSIHRVVPESPLFPRHTQSDLPSPARFKMRRTSEDSGFTRPADLARNFEELIQSNETLQYTLTPENMRDIDSQSTHRNGSPRTSHRPGKSDDAIMGDNSRASSIKRSISISRSTGLGSHPPDMVAGGMYATGAMASRNRAGPPPQARDARVARESLQDFAEFIRSTGPTGESIPRTNRPPTVDSNSARSITGLSSIRKSSSMEARRGPKLLARDAVINSSKESSELIDFIRQGPPPTNGNAPRISRAIAPFRSTQDSDYMVGGVGGKAVDAVIPNFRTSRTSTNITETSVPSSMNSQSALLNRSNWQPPQTFSGFDEDDIMPKRTRRRVRDPYAIDFSDEEDDFYDPVPKPPPKNEESLIDFLNNYPPPAEPVTQPIVPAKKKSSSPNLIARLRSGTSSSLYGSNHGRKSSSSSENRSINSQKGSRPTHTPIVIPTVLDKFTPSATAMDAPRTTPFRRVPMKKFEPRDAPLSYSQTNDLAEFLRVSQPQPELPPTPASEDKASSGFARIFERRKKSTAY
ncbi:hypothetical protein GGR50DRAFT_338457 [Xylaria sp. CBS 124048]|nr:hypothetical protein GGR50DRAFT_338457 [Xylaria sp. CBS 124048]